MAISERQRTIAAYIAKLAEGRINPERSGSTTLYITFPAKPEERFSVAPNVTRFEVRREGGDGWFASKTYQNAKLIAQAASTK